MRTFAVQACILSLLFTVQAASAHSLHNDGSAPGGAQNAPGYSATLEQCVTSAIQAERSATFTGRMVATGDTRRMGMRIEVQQRLRKSPAFHIVVAPGLEVWRNSEPGVKIYKYMKQITNLVAPAVYRAVVRFRWVDARGRVIKRAELRTARCDQRPLLAHAPGT